MILIHRYLSANPDPTNSNVFGYNNKCCWPRHFNGDNVYVGASAAVSARTDGTRSDPYDSRAQRPTPLNHNVYRG